MEGDISTLTTGEIRDILAVCQGKAGNLIDSKELRGYYLPGKKRRGVNKKRRVNLEDLIKFIDKHKFPRTRLLRFIEEHGATKEELERYNITEPIGRGNIRFYPEIPPHRERPDILTTGEAASIFDCAISTISEGCDKGALDYCRLPGENTERRITVDALARYFIKEGNYIPPGLEGKSFLLVSYPGGWKEAQRVFSIPDSDISVWYRDNEDAQEVSIRCKNNGLYMKLVKGICNLIFLGITGREESGKITHPNHTEQIASYLNKDPNLPLSALAHTSDEARKALEVIVYSKKQFDDYINGQAK